MGTIDHTAVHSLIEAGDLSVAYERLLHADAADSRTNELFALVQVLMMAEAEAINSEDASLPMVELAQSMGLSESGAMRWRFSLLFQAGEREALRRYAEDNEDFRSKWPDLDYLYLLTLIDLGEFEAVQTRLDTYDDRGRGSGLMRSIRCRLLNREGKYQETLDLLAPLLAREDLPSLLRFHIHVEAGEAFDRMGEAKRAFESFSTKHRCFPIEAWDRTEFLDKVMTAIPQSGEWLEDVARRADPSLPSTVFICAAARSGTTLLARRLAGHVQGIDIGESQLFQSRNVKLLLEHEDQEEVRHEVLRCLRAKDDEARLFIDKNVTNWQWVTSLASVAPNAQYVALQRDLVDVGLSTWASSLTQRNLDWVPRLDWLGWQLGVVDAVLDYWTSTYPTLFVKVSYEELVVDEASTLSRIQAHLREGTYASKTLDQVKPGATPRATISSINAARPTHQRSLGRAAKYGSMLDPLREGIFEGRAATKERLAEL